MHARTEFCDLTDGRKLPSPCHPRPWCASSLLLYLCLFCSLPATLKFSASSLPPISDRIKFAGTVPYMAPEILSKQPYTFSADIYAFAVLFNETLIAERPFEGFSVDHVMHDVVATGLRPRVSSSSPQALQLIQQVWYSTLFSSNRQRQTNSSGFSMHRVAHALAATGFSSRTGSSLHRVLQPIEHV